MEQHSHYGTVSEAINKFREKGFTIDFNLKENCVDDNGKCKYKSNDLEIIDLYRYEGDSDPADEAVVYAIESKNGEKGILVSGYGISSDSISTEMLRKLKFRVYS